MTSPGHSTDIDEISFMFRSLWWRSPANNSNRQHYSRCGGGTIGDVPRLRAGMNLASAWSRVEIQPHASAGSACWPHSPLSRLLSTEQKIPLKLPGGGFYSWFCVKIQN
jgi:hypothetical protein